MIPYCRDYFVVLIMINNHKNQITLAQNGTPVLIYSERRHFSWFVSWFPLYASGHKTQYVSILVGAIDSAEVWSSVLCNVRARQHRPWLWRESTRSSAISICLVTRERISLGVSYTSVPPQTGNFQLYCVNVIINVIQRESRLPTFNALPTLLFLPT